MGIIWALVIGCVIGALLQLFVPRPAQGDLVIRMLLGIAGALVGSFIGRAFFGLGLDNVPVSMEFLPADLGAIVLLGIYELLTRRARRG